VTWPSLPSAHNYQLFLSELFHICILSVTSSSDYYLFPSFFYRIIITSLPPSIQYQLVPSSFHSTKSHSINLSSLTFLAEIILSVIPSIKSSSLPFILPSDPYLSPSFFHSIIISSLLPSIRSSSIIVSPFSTPGAQHPLPFHYHEIIISLLPFHHIVIFFLPHSIRSSFPLFLPSDYHFLILLHQIINPSLPPSTGSSFLISSLISFRNPFHQTIITSLSLS
jgi:hypothetical protein